MKAVVHILYKDKDANKNNLFKHKNLCEYIYKHFLVTNECDLKKTIYKDFEQIFHIKEETSLTASLTSILKFLKQFGYTEIIINNCNDEFNLTDIKNVDELITNFSVINNIINV
jgi:hypothetical protein